MIAAALGNNHELAAEAACRRNTMSQASETTSQLQARQGLAAHWGMGKCNGFVAAKTKLRPNERMKRIVSRPGDAEILGTGRVYLELPSRPAQLQFALAVVRVCPSGAFQVVLGGGGSWPGATQHFYHSREARCSAGGYPSPLGWWGTCGVVKGEGENLNLTIN